jgi:hypothetical protein
MIIYNNYKVVSSVKLIVDPQKKLAKSTHKSQPPAPDHEPIRRVSVHNTPLPPDPAASYAATYPYRYADVAFSPDSPVHRRNSMMSSHAQVLDAVVFVV